MQASKFKHSYYKKHFEVKDIMVVVVVVIVVVVIVVGIVVIFYFNYFTCVYIRIEANIAKIGVAVRFVTLQISSNNPSGF